jgi:hypothetical protein
VYRFAININILADRPRRVRRRTIPPSGERTAPNVIQFPGPHLREKTSAAAEKPGD